MNTFIENYKYLIYPFLLWFLTQMYKVAYDLIKYKKLNPKRIIGAGRNAKFSFCLCYGFSYNAW